MVLITPHVVDNMQKARKVTEELRRKLPTVEAVLGKSEYACATSAAGRWCRCCGADHARADGGGDGSVDRDLLSHRTARHRGSRGAGQRLDAAVVRAVLGISDLRPQSRWRVDGAHRAMIYRGIAIDVSAQDEIGRIDLNSASGSLIRQLLTSNGVDGDAAGALKERILSWRSATGLQMLSGGSNSDYRAAGLPYGPRHGPFQTVEELKLVLGMTPRLFARIRPALTVYSKRASFNSSVAPREALMAIYPNDPARIDQILQAREGAPGAVVGTGSVPGQANSAPSAAGHAFSIVASTTNGNRTFTRMAVVQLTGDDKRPYFVLAWQ